MPLDTINILDLLSQNKATKKVQNLADKQISIKLDDFEKKLDKQLEQLYKRLQNIEKMNVDSMVSNAIQKSEDDIRAIITDEVARIFFSLYVKRNAWKN